MAQQMSVDNLRILISMANTQKQLKKKKQSNKTTEKIINK